MSDREKHDTPDKPLRSLSSREESLELRRHYLQNLVHELSSPLTPLLGYLKLFEKRSLGDLTELQQTCLGRMNRSAGRLQRILEDFSNLLQMESGMYEPQPLPVELDTVISRALKHNESLIEDSKIEVLIEPPPPTGLTLVGDQSKLIAAVDHLVSNSLKFNSAGGKIMIRCQPISGGRVRIEVFDTGIGLQTDDRERVFDPFYQFDHSETRRFEGAGLGLSLVKWVVEIHGGTIRLESPPSEQPDGHFFRGVRAILELPIQAP